jgi:hypothetical protein
MPLAGFPAFSQVTNQPHHFPKFLKQISNPVSQYIPLPPKTQTRPTQQPIP